ncbi:MAG: peptide ABC transporter permease [Gammaproteobacteria bacterium RIFCSPHIGHO2_12_FULL_41_15]|nr:MAG: peptide ABC transporter permease [Gammaproteobacteria bacterium RIFCSPHIGHO2_12_FULL_41_15]
MLTYIIRRILYAIPILILVNVITFSLFFIVNSPDDMARMHLGQKHVTQQTIDNWKKYQGYDKPLFYNASDKGVRKLTNTLFMNKSLALLRFNFGSSDQGRDISQDIFERMWPSLALAIPTLLIGLLVNITGSLLLALFLGTGIDIAGVTLCVILMSLSGLFYIIFGQFIFAKMLNLVPISGYQSGLDSIKFLILPVAIGVISGIGGGVRWYRTIILEEVHKEYVRTARSKGLTWWQVMRKHILPNALIPILTGVVVIIPTLFMGSLIMESFFGIPGLGSYTIEAIQAQDFDIVRVMVYLGTLLYVLGLILTDISYTIVDPRVRLE